MSFLNKFRKQQTSERNMVTVPPGHEVVVVKTAPQAMLVQMRSAVWVADFGPDAECEGLFQVAENLLRQNSASSIIWVIQTNVVAYWTSELPRLVRCLQRFHQVRRIRGPQVETGDIAVVSDMHPNAQALMLLLCSLGIGVHLPGPEGEIFIEVHRPDHSIVVGMAGPEFSSTPDRFLRDLNLERDQVGQSPDATAKLYEIGEREVTFVAQVLQSAAA